MQKFVNLVDLEKRCKMSICLQRLVPIQPRTSPVKFDHLAENRVKIQYRIFQLSVHERAKERRGASVDVQGCASGNGQLQDPEEEIHRRLIRDLPT